VNINVQVDASPLILRFEKGERRLVFGVVDSINHAMRDAQRGVQESVGRKFIIRNAPFFFGTPGRPGGAAARISPFASVPGKRLYAEISVGASTRAGSRRLLLSEFEKGGTREPMTPGAKSVAVPLLGRPARPSIKRGVPPQYTFAGLQFKAFKGKVAIKRRTTRSGGLSLFDEFGRRRDSSELGTVQWKGRERTFILKKSAREPLGGVYQRIGAARGDIRLIYAFRRGMRLDARLGFIPTVTRIAPPRFKEYMERAAIEAIGRSGGRPA
jgi:hypothetical protein